MFPGPALALIPSPARHVWQLGPLPVRAQALAVAAGVVVALAVAGLSYRRAGGSRGVIADVAAWVVPAALLPAAAGALTQTRAQPWAAVHATVAAVGFPCGAGLGLLAAWLACRRMFPGRAVRLGPVLTAATPAAAFGDAVAQLGDWAAQRGFGDPSSLPWAVAIDPVHRPSGFENFATFVPVFLYHTIWDVTVGIGLMVVARRYRPTGARLLALGAIGYGAAGLCLFWLGIGEMPIMTGLRPAQLCDAAVIVGAIGYLIRSRRRHPRQPQGAHKSDLARDTPVM